MPWEGSTRRTAPSQAGVDRPGALEDAGRDGRLAVVDVADDGEVADVLNGHGSTGGYWGGHGLWIVPAPGADLDRHLLSLCPAQLGRRRRRRGPATDSPQPSEHTEDLHVANIQSQIKRNRQNEKRRQRNKSVRAELRTRTKNAVLAAENGTEDSVEQLRLAVKRIDKAAARGVIHKNTAANHKSRLVRRGAILEAAAADTEQGFARPSLTLP